MITQEKLKELFYYDLETGIFTRKTEAGRYGRLPIGSIVGSRHSQGYLIVVIDGKNYRLHRLAWLYVYGYLPKEIDHINNIKDDNRINNLRECSRSQNVLNYRNKANSTTGVKGVSFTSGRCPRYVANIKADGMIHTKTFTISKYESKELALEAATQWVRNKRVELHGSFANHG